MNNAANTQNLIANCRHSRLRAALAMPQAPKAAEVPVAVTTTATGGFAKKAASLLLVAFVYFFFGAFASVDYSAYETATDSGEVAICQTAPDGTVSIVTVSTQS